MCVCVCVCVCVSRVGVEVIGDDSLIEAIVKSDNAISFDRLIATPEWAKKLARAGKALGPKGLMPNVKVSVCTYTHIHTHTHTCRVAGVRRASCLTSR